MNTLSPAQTDAFGLLIQDLYLHLEEAEYLAQQDGEWSTDELTQARKLIQDLVYVVHGLLVEHRVQPSGDCKVCTSRWPCAVVTTIHAVVKDPARQFSALVEQSRDDD